MTPAITRDDLRAFAEDIKENLGTRIDSLTVQVRETNGRVRRLEIDAAVQEQRTASLETERGARRLLLAGDDGGGGITITKKQLTGWIGIGTMAGAALVKLWPLFAQGLK